MATRQFILRKARFGNLRVFKNLFGDGSKIHADEIAVAPGLLLGGAVIVESGSNENGEYVRFGDGTQICWQRFYAGTRTYVGEGTYANPYRSNTINWTFPKPFMSPPTLSLTGQVASGNASARANSCGCSTDITGTRVVNIQCVMLTSNNTAADVYIYALAIGRWK